MNLPAFPWIDDPRIKVVLEALEAGAPDCVRFVGGCVRDSLLAVETGVGESMPHDIDMATTLLPHDVMKVLQGSGLKVVPTGIYHGTVTAIVEGLPIEITTLRVDEKTDGRHAAVSFGQNWEEDAKRRDFTMNALYLNPDGSVYDPLDGMADLKNRCVRFIGVPSERIAEDYLRILRFFRFSARFGSSFHPQSLAAIEENIAGLRRISRERIRDELLKILITPHAPLAVLKMNEIGVFKVLVESNLSLDEFTRVFTTLQVLPPPMRGLVESPELLLLGSLYPDISPQALMGAFCLSRKSMLWLQRVRMLVERFGYPADEQSLTALHYYGGVAAARSVLLLTGEVASQNDGGGSTENTRLVQDMEMLGRWRQHKFPVRGGDIAPISGPAIGQALRDIEAAWVKAGFPEDQITINRLISSTLKRFKGNLPD